MAKLRNALLQLFDPNHQHIATWIQTLVVVLGVIVANLQLGALVETNDLTRRKAFHDLYEEYRTSFQQQITAVNTAVYRAGFANTSEQEMKDAFAASNPKQTLKTYLDFLVRVVDCGDDGVCDPSQTSSFVCQKAKRTWSALNYHQQNIRLAAWKGLDMQQYSAELDNLISGECGYFDALWFRISSSD